MQFVFAVISNYYSNVAAVSAWSFVNPKPLPALVQIGVFVSYIFRPPPATVRRFTASRAQAQASLHALEQRWLKTFVRSTGVARLTHPTTSSPSSSGSSQARSLARLVPAPPLVEYDTGPMANLHSQAAPTTPVGQWLARADDHVSRNCSSEGKDSRLNTGGRHYSSLNSDREAAMAKAGADLELPNCEFWASGGNQRVHRSVPNVDAIERDRDSAAPSSRYGQSVSDGPTCRSDVGQSQQRFQAERARERHLTRDEWKRRPRGVSHLTSWIRGDERRGRESSDGRDTGNEGHPSRWHLQGPDPVNTFQDRASPPPSSSKEWSSTPGPAMWRDLQEHGDNRVPERSKLVHAECPGHGSTTQPYPIYSKRHGYHAPAPTTLQVEMNAGTPPFSPPESSFLGNEQQHLPKRTFPFTITSREGDEGRGGQPHGGWPRGYTNGSPTNFGQRAGMVTMYPRYSDTALTRSARRREFPPMGYQVDRDVGYRLRGRGHSDNCDSSGSSSANHSPGLRSLGGMSSFRRKHLPRPVHLGDDEKSSSSEFFPIDPRRDTAKDTAFATPAPAADDGRKALLGLSGRARVGVEEEHEQARVRSWSVGRQDHSENSGRYFSATGDDVGVLPGDGACGYNAVDRRHHNDIEVKWPVPGGDSNTCPGGDGDGYRIAGRRRHSDNAVMGHRVDIAGRTPLIRSNSRRRWAEEAVGLTRQSIWELNGKRRRQEGNNEGARDASPRMAYLCSRVGKDPDDPGRDHFSSSFGRRETVVRSERQVDWNVDGEGRSRENAGGCDVEGERGPTGEPS